ncbi:EF-hand domain-containing protein [Sphingomonas sp. NFR15]|uniref:EF-hand domain-containing protein n=1 Tax=Sphingomonas sp. NFR15 TaxID=1566282 RepID=UPI000890B68D|nr:EF-hand domain-containing protein [Sphingomonas sp. NFR15]SDA11947.1 EF hand [Sphingomonas sp. NFR15]
MWRYLAGGLAALLLLAAGFIYYTGRGANGIGLPLAAVQAASPTRSDDPLPDTVPEASDKTREQKRLARYDKNDDGNVTREEYLAPRRKAFAKLDANHDGTLSFDEWAAKTEAKFAGADADKSGALNAAEFAATAPKRKSRVRARCPENQQTAPARDEDS